MQALLCYWLDLGSQLWYEASVFFEDWKNRSAVGKPYLNKQGKIKKFERILDMEAFDTPLESIFIFIEDLLVSAFPMILGMNGKTVFTL